MYVNTNASYTPTSSRAIGDRVWIPPGVRLEGLGDATLDMVLRLSTDQRQELANLVNRQLSQLPTVKRKQVESGLGFIGPVASVASAASTGAGVAESSIFTAANIASAINGLTQVGIGVAQLRLTQMDKTRQQEIAQAGVDAANRATAAAQQQTAAISQQGAVAAAQGKKWVPWAIGSGAVLVLGTIAIFAIRSRNRRK